MSFTSSIEWTESTWNPVTGCTKVSPGCKFCYAERFAERFRGVKGHPYEQGFDLKLHPDRLLQPLGWKAPRLVFVNSMSDLFHEAVDFTFVSRVFATMIEAAHHSFQVLTKRPDRLLEFATTTNVRIPGNVWVGVSVETQKYADRVDLLRRVQAPVKFLSCEPLLGPLELNLDGIHWVIVGGESGSRPRPMHPDWVRGIRRQCLSSRVPFFFKQWGGRNKKKAGRILDGQTWDEMPAVRQGIVPQKEMTL